MIFQSSIPFIGPILIPVVVLQDGLSSGHASDLDEEAGEDDEAATRAQPSALNFLKLQAAHTCVRWGACLLVCMLNVCFFVCVCVSVSVFSVSS